MKRAGKSFQAFKDLREQAAPVASLVTQSMAETLWPTRCALCDAPGSVLCERCARNLPYLDPLTACPRCGAPFGKWQCTECNPVALLRMGIDALPFEACASAVLFSAETGRIVRTYKDADERRLASFIGTAIARMVPPAWPIDGVTFVPATSAAVRRRGFDHAELLARTVSRELGRPCLSTLARPHAADQRKLSRAERIHNVHGRFSPNKEAARTAQLAPRILVIDDVYTTGSTLCDAAIALKQAGFEEVRCATFARVY